MTKSSSLLGVEGHVAVDGVVDDDVAAVEGHLDAQDVGLASIDAALGLCGVHVAAGALVALEGVLALLGGGAVGRELLGRAEAGVGLALVPEPLGGLLVEVEALGLGVGAKVAADLGTLVPVKAQPAHGAQDDLGVLVSGAGGVGVVDAQDERAAVGAGKGPVVDGGAGAADVQLAGGGRRKANAHGLVCHGVSSSLGSYLHMVHQYSAVRTTRRPRPFSAQPPHCPNNWPPRCPGRRRRRASSPQRQQSGKAPPSPRQTLCEA